MSETEDGSKQPRLRIGGERITKTDYGGFVAIILTIGFILLLALHRIAEAAVLGPFVGWFLRDYFFGPR